MLTMKKRKREQKREKEKKRATHTERKTKKTEKERQRKGERANLTTSCILFLNSPSTFSEGNPIATMLGLMSLLESRNNLRKILTATIQTCTVSVSVFHSLSHPFSVFLFLSLCLSLSLFLSVCGCRYLSKEGLKLYKLIVRFFSCVYKTHYTHIIQ